MSSLELIKAARLLGFDAKSGWPKTLTDVQLAFLQTRDDTKDPKLQRDANRDFRALMELGIQSGELVHTTHSVLKSERRLVHSGGLAASRSWEGAGFGGFLGARLPIDGLAPSRARFVVDQVPVSVVQITATDFCTWLQAQSIEPSTLVVAWFKAWNAEPSVAVGVEPEAVRSYADLMEFRRANPGMPWTDDMRELLAAEEQRRKKLLGARGVRRAMASELDISDKRIGALITQHKASVRKAGPIRLTGTY